MMSFEYERPSDWAEAGRLLAMQGSVAKMGGCDVLTRFRSGRLHAKLVVGLNRLPGVDELTVDATGVRIGAAVTLARLAGTPTFAHSWPVLAQVVARIGSPTIRATGTVVGNIAQGWSVSDLVPLFQVCDAELEIRGPMGLRRLSVSDYAHLAGTTALRPGEVIAALVLKASTPALRMGYERFTFKKGFDLPLVSVAVAASMSGGVCSDVRVAAVGAHAMPRRSAAIEAAIEGNHVDSRSTDNAIAAMVAWADPPDDFRASSEYRQHLLTIVLRRALTKLSAT